MKAKAIKFTEFDKMSKKQLNDIERKIYAQLKRYMLADTYFLNECKTFALDIEETAEYASKEVASSLHEFGHGYSFVSAKHYDDIEVCDVHVSAKRVVIIDVSAVYHWLFSEFYE